jgi:hypothetical protein
MYLSSLLPGKAKERHFFGYAGMFPKLVLLNLLSATCAASTVDSILK